MIYPPRPNNITIPAVVAGNILQSDNTSVSVIDAGNDGAIVMKTENTLAMMIDYQQRTMINTSTATGMLNVNSDINTIPTIRLSYQDNTYFDMSMTAGGVVFNTSADDAGADLLLKTSFKRNVDFINHDGMTTGIHLGGILVTASASELNYVDVTPGIATAAKAVILDSSKNISTINRVTANELSGTILTGNQPYISSLSTVNVTDALYISGVKFDISADTLQYINLPNSQEGYVFPRKAMIVDVNRNIVNINELHANYLYGTLGTGPQPNITSLNSLLSLTNTGPTTLGGPTSITATTTQLFINYNATRTASLTTDSNGLLVLNTSGNYVQILKGLNINGHNGINQGLYLGGYLVTATADQINRLSVAAGTATALKVIVPDSNNTVVGFNNISANTLSGTITTSNQPGIARVNALDITTHDGATVGLKLGGTLVTATAAQLNSVNVTPGVAQANGALILNSTLGISGISSLSSNTISGTILTGTQPYINQINVLNIYGHNGSSMGLSLNGNLVTATAAELNYVDVLEIGVAQPSKALVLDSNKIISGIESLYANQLYGQISTGPQPNITSVTTLDITGHNGGTLGLRLGGVLITCTGNEINYLDVTAGIAQTNHALVTNSSNEIRNITLVQSTYLEGIISTSFQPSITSVNSLNILNHNGSTNGLSLAGILVTATATQINALNVIFGFGTSSKALILDSNRNIGNINNLSASTLTGTLQTSAQPNITSVNSLNIAAHDGSFNGLSLGGTLVKATANQLNYLTISTLGVAESSKALVLSSTREISNILTISANNINGTILTSSQPNITSVNTLNIVNHNGSTGLQLNNTLVTASATQINRINVAAGTADASKALVLDATRSITNINSLSASTLTGVIQTAYQPNITSVNTLNIINHDGGNTGLMLNNTLVAATANQLNYNVVVPGTASSTHALVTDTFNSIGNINNLSAQQLNVNKLVLSSIISNFNTGSLVMKSYSFTNLVGRLIDTRLITSLVFNSFTPADGVTSGYSSEIIGYVLPPSSSNYTFYITCNDRVRVWVNGTLILHSWVALTSQRTSSSIFLNANQWASIYIQYQVDTGNVPKLSVTWSSGSFAQTTINANQMAWDNNTPPNKINFCSQNSLMIYNSDTSSQNTVLFTVDTGGNLSMDASGNNITLGAQDNFNIPSHTGGGSGLMLGGVLVQPTAYELNYLKINPGVATASKAVVLDGSKSISGLNSVSATSVVCTNLNASNFTISTLSLNGPLNNYNNGQLLIRQLTGANATGRVVNVATIQSLNFSSYDPNGLNLNYSLDISGFIQPTRSDTHQFYIIASGYVRLWINNVLILNRWDSATNVEYVSAPIALTQGQWVTFYLQFQNISTESISIQSAVSVQWSTPLMTKQYINSSSMAWDNTMVAPARPLYASDTVTVYNSSTNLIAPETGSISVDILGSLQLSGSGNIVSVSSGNDFNIISHNGINGLRLNGTLVTATADELNYLAGATPGNAAPNKAVILSSSGNLQGFTLLGGQYLSGILTTTAQPNIQSVGTLNQTLNTQSDIILTSTNSMRFGVNATACYIQGYASTTTNSAADIFFGNYNTTVSTSNRKFMIKDSGRVGIQTSAPARALTINGAGSAYCMRLVNNASDGSETQYVDIGVDASSNIVIGSTGAGSSTIGVSASGIMKIIPSGGSLQIGNTPNNVLPLEVGSVNYTVSSVVGYLNSSGSAGTVIPTDVTYSLRTTASIIVNGTVCVTSDARLKQNIKSLDEEQCYRFIENSNPISFEYTNDSRKQVHYGLIAQDVAQGEFASLVNISPYPGLKSSNIDGFISPENASFNVSYEEIIPIMLKTTKSVMAENKNLKRKMDSMEKIIEQLLNDIAILKETIN